MKTRIFKTVFPIMAFVIAIMGAFAFNSVPEKDTKAVAQFLGHYKENGICVDSGVMCQDEIVTTPCKSGTKDLFKRLSNTNCPDQLWEIEQ